MFSQTAEYALRVVLYLASLKEQPATIHQIHVATRIPEGYLAKVMQSLSRGKIIHSLRGLHGGSTLAISSDTLSVHAVLQAVHPFERFLKCPLKIPSHNPSLCPLHKRLDQAMAMVEQAFKDTTIAELLTEPGPMPLGEKGNVVDIGITKKP
jgi:Rrf2 family transcriptional regulator, nitric oxide-sensitive transcriptional repressor